LIAIPQIIGWIFVVIATNPYYLMAFRFLAGFAGGGVYVVLPLYVSEISEDRIRGTLGCLIVLITNYGVLLAYILGTFLKYEAIPWVCMPISILFLIGFWKLPDTPAYLMAKNRYEVYLLLILEPLILIISFPGSGTFNEILSEDQKVRGR
jgi:MFS family permease